MIKSRNRIVLVFLLALLQCFAPLLHAHTHGQSGAGGVHMHGGIEWQLADLPSSTPYLIAERVNAPVIAMAQEYRQDSVMVLSDADQPGLAVSSSLLTRFSLSFSPVIIAGRHSPGGMLPYARPFSQAPPLILI